MEISQPVLRLGNAVDTDDCARQTVRARTPRNFESEAYEWDDPMDARPMSFGP